MMVESNRIATPSPIAVGDDPPVLHVASDPPLSHPPDATPGETSLFRYPRQYAALAALACDRAKRELSTWVLSVGCSTGEEAWGAAAVLDAAYAGKAAWKVEGIDLDSARLVTATRGEYAERSTRRGLGEYQRYFSGTTNVRVLDRLRPRTLFRRADVASSVWLGAFRAGPAPDAVFFCNVGIYWPRERAQTWIDAVAGHLPPHGLLFIAGTDPWPSGAWDVEVASDGVVCRRRPIPTQPRATARLARSQPERVTRPVETTTPPAAPRPAPATRASSEIAPAAETSVSIEERFLAGVQHLERGEAAEARRFFRQCTFLAPNEPRYRRWLELVRELEGE
jgi:chemotaxis methyl-accepting protein methylase